MSVPLHDWSRVDAGLFHLPPAMVQALCDKLNLELTDGYFALSEPASNERTPGDSSEPERYAARASRIAIRHTMGHVVSVLEIVSPGNKGSRTALRAFVLKAVDLLRQGVNLLIVDLFPPSARDPHGIHKAIWDEIREEPFELPGGKPLTLAAYAAGPMVTACVEPVSVGDVLPDMPIFLEGGGRVAAPLEEAYEMTWSVCPEALRAVVEAAGG